MTILRNMTIRHKLTLIIMFTCICALSLAGIALVEWGQVAARQAMAANLSTQAQMIADNCKAAVAFEDTEDAGETLKALRAQPSIVFGEVHTKSGEHFADYCRDGTDKHTLIEHQDDGYSFGHGHLTVFKSVVLDGEKIGTVCLRSDLELLHAMLRRNTIIIAVVLLFASAVAYLVSSGVQTVISGPILSLAEAARTVSEQKDYSVRVQKDSNDEVGLLVGAFNEMLNQIQRHQVALIEANEQLEDRVRQRTAQLEETHNKLMDASRQAGMAEVATDVLHNVGNVLNSINVAATLIREKVSNSEVLSLKKVTDIVKEHVADIGTFLTEDEQGRHIPAYLTEVSKALIDEQADTIEKLRSLTENVEHIKEIVKTQQSYAKVSGMEVSTSLVELVENAIHINGAAMERHGVQLVRDFAEVGPISIDKQKVLQILVNLISNAKYAMSRVGKGEKSLAVRIYKHGADKVRIEVADSGVGISEENLMKIFTHGFTTKKDGHGFGLHSGALTAAELGGSLTAHSDGVDRGATFTLELPFEPAEVTQ
jgi:two-component system NtrC family sensor kinase